MSKTLLRHTLIKKIFLTFLLKPYLYTFSLYENPSFIIFSAETKWSTIPTKRTNSSHLKSFNIKSHDRCRSHCWRAQTYGVAKPVNDILIKYSLDIRTQFVSYILFVPFAVYILVSIYWHIIMLSLKINTTNEQQVDHLNFKLWTTKFSNYTVNENSLIILHRLFNLWL